MPDLLTALQQQIEELSSALCQIPGTLYLKTESEGEIDVESGVPDMQPLSQRLTSLIDALPQVDPDVLQHREGHVVELWKKRNALDAELRQGLTELQELQARLSRVHEALVIGAKRTAETQNVQQN